MKNSIIFISLGLLILLVSYYLADKTLKAEKVILDKDPTIEQNVVNNYNMNIKRVTYTLLYFVLSIFSLYIFVFLGLVLFFLICKTIKKSIKIKKSKKVKFNM